MVQCLYSIVKKEESKLKKINIRRLITLVFNCFFVLSFFSMALATTTVVVPEEVKTTLTNITKILLLIGTAVCVGKVIHIGILYLTSSVAEKVNAKQAMVPWIIGTIVCFGAATIGGAIIKIFTEAGTPGNVLDY